VTNSSNKVWDPRMEFDPITASPNGSTIWHDYGAIRRIVVTKPVENPRDVVARENNDYLLCACGCGRPVPKKGAFIEGHKERMEQWN
jgi:hypothetical protein